MARIEGRDPDAPSLTLLGHTDVVPANGEDWRHDPFGGELVDGEVWGRGAVDMLNLTASMAVAVRHLADEGFRPDGDLVFIGVADEEALGSHGARWLTEHAPDDVRTDYLITEAGGFPMASPDGVRLPVITGEKGAFWCTLTVRGTPGHASQPLRTDNALVKAAEVVRRLAEHETPADIHDAWRRFVEGIGLPAEFAGPLLDPDAHRRVLRDPPPARPRPPGPRLHPHDHGPHGPAGRDQGQRHPRPRRTSRSTSGRLPGWERPDVEAMIDDALGDLAGDVEIDLELHRRRQHLADRHPAVGRPRAGGPAVATPTPDASPSSPWAPPTPASSAGSAPSPTASASSASDCRFEDYATMFHGVDERVDVDSLGAVGRALGRRGPRSRCGERAG